MGSGSEVLQEQNKKTFIYLFIVCKARMWCKSKFLMKQQIAVKWKKEAKDWSIYAAF